MKVHIITLQRTMTICSTSLLATLQNTSYFSKLSTFRSETPPSQIYFIAIALHNTPSFNHLACISPKLKGQTRLNTRSELQQTK